MVDAILAFLAGIGVAAVIGGRALLHRLKELHEDNVKAADLLLGSDAVTADTLAAADDRREVPAGGDKSAVIVSAEDHDE